MLKHLAVAIAAVLAFTGAASAQTAAGDWAGEMTMPQGAVQVAMHITQDPAGVLGGTIESPDLNATLPVTGGKLEADKLTLSSAEGEGHRLDLAWDAPTAGWKGQYFGAIGTFPVALKPGALGPRAIVAGLDGEWAGTLSVQGLSLPLELTVATAPETGTSATFRSPQQSDIAIPVGIISKEGETVMFAIPSIQVAYDGKLDAEGKTIAGAFTQGGFSLPLTLTRK